MAFFVTAAELGSFAEASELLNITPPALSLAIKNLEDEVGGQLFERRQRRIYLTPEGKYFLPMAKNLLRDWDDSLDKLQQRMVLERGSLTIAAMPSFAGYALPKCLAEFQRANPNINLSVIDVVMEDVIDLVERQQVDLGITFESDKASSTRFIPLFTDQFIAVVSPTNPMADKAEIKLDDLIASPLITLNKESAVRRWVDDCLFRHGKSISHRIECRNLATVGAMVAAGVGVAIVPNLCRTPMAAQGAIPLTLIDASISRRVGIHLSLQNPSSITNKAIQKLLTEYALKYLDLHAKPDY